MFGEDCFKSSRGTPLGWYGVPHEKDGPPTSTSGRTATRGNGGSVLNLKGRYMLSSGSRTSGSVVQGKRWTGEALYIGNVVYGYSGSACV